MDTNQYFNIENLAGQQIPPEIVEQLKVLGRVQFPLKPTTASAVSTSAQEPSDTQKDNAANISGMVNHVADMENITEQLEDMIDELTKNMKIPVEPGNTALLNAVKALGGDTEITKDIFDKALAIVDYGPLLLGPDPVGIILGNGKIDGPFSNCDEITRGLAKTWNSASPKDVNPEEPFRDATTEIAEEFEKSIEKQVLEMLLMLWWNMMWPKFVVMLVIINPIRTLIAYPFDRIITFFKDMKKRCNKARFKIKPDECLKSYGPINKALNRLACFLLCKIPPKLYKRYKPMIDPSEFMIIKNGKLVPCDCKAKDDCPPKSKPRDDFKKDGDFDQIGNLLESIDDPCVGADDYLDDVNTDQPEGLGMPSNCLKYAQTILSAVVSDALSPPDSSTSSSGSKSVSSILENQTNQLGV